VKSGGIPLRGRLFGTLPEGDDRSSNVIGETPIYKGGATSQKLEMLLIEKMVYEPIFFLDMDTAYVQPCPVKRCSKVNLLKSECTHRGEDGASFL